MDPNWKRIAGIHCQDEGTIGVVWLAHDQIADVFHLYDCCLFRREVLVVIADGINCRGKWIPVAWREPDKEISNKLLDRGCKMIYEPYKDTDKEAEVYSREIWERMRSARFKVNKRNKEWLDEYQSFYRDESKVPKDTFPLMSATRCATAMMSYAKRQAVKKSTANYPRINVL